MNVERGESSRNQNLEASGQRVIIIGAGMSGLLAGIRLLEKGHENFVIYEKAEELGGTWRDNRYPGLSCDVPSHHYVYSFEPNPDWTELFSSGPEILEYFKRAADKYGVRKQVLCGEEVISAVYEGRYWSITTARGTTDKARVLIAATGVLHHPKYPDIQGIDDFTGNRFHSARWDDSVSLKNKRVGVVGTGSTAIQIVPAIVDQVAQLKLFQRTAQWILPYPNKTYTMAEREAFRDKPELMRNLYEKWEGQFNHTFARAVIGDKSEMRRIEERCVQNLQTNVIDPELRTKLTPDYEVACKRLILSDLFYPAIQRNNAELVTEKISHFAKAGIVMQNGKLHELDVVVLATGFDGHRYTRDIDIVGAHGTSLNDTWGDSIWAHRGVAVPDFPNFFMLIGPHSPIGNFSLILIAEMQFNYLLELIAPLLDGTWNSVVPRKSSTDEFNRSLKLAMTDTVWVSGCDSWYLDSKGNPITWPWTFEKFEDDMAAPDLAEFVIEPGPDNQLA